MGVQRARDFADQMRRSTGHPVFSISVYGTEQLLINSRPVYSNVDS